jgi:hypothetical protein
MKDLHKRGKAGLLLIQNAYDLRDSVCSTVNVLQFRYRAMNLGEIGMFVAVGFIPTLIALELVYRMGKAIGKRGEISHMARHTLVS